MHGSTYDITPSLFRVLISSDFIPRSSVKTSVVCCPKVGGGSRMLGCVSLNFTGGLTSLIGPHVGCSTSVIMFRSSAVAETVC